MFEKVKYWIRVRLERARHWIRVRFGRVRYWTRVRLKRVRHWIRAMPERVRRWITRYIIWLLGRRNDIYYETLLLGSTHSLALGRKLLRGFINYGVGHHACDEYDADYAWLIVLVGFIVIDVQVWSGSEPIYGSSLKIRIM